MISSEYGSKEEIANNILVKKMVAYKILEESEIVYIHIPQMKMEI